MDFSPCFDTFTSQANAILEMCGLIELFKIPYFKKKGTRGNLSPVCFKTKPWWRESSLAAGGPWEETRCHTNQKLFDCDYIFSNPALDAKIISMQCSSMLFHSQKSTRCMTKLTWDPFILFNVALPKSSKLISSNKCKPVSCTCHGSLAQSKAKMWILGRHTWSSAGNITGRHTWSHKL